MNHPREDPLTSTFGYGGRCNGEMRSWSGSKTVETKDRISGHAADGTVLNIHGLEFGTYRIQDVRDVEDG